MNERMLKSLAILLFLAGGGWGQSETPIVPDTVTLEKAVETALQNHHSVKIARLGVEKEEALVKSAFDLGITHFAYSKGELNGPVADHEWSVSQEIKFPTAYVSQARRQMRKVEVSRTALDAAKLDLECNTRSAWLQWAYGESRLKVLAELETAYAAFADAAEKRYQAGETHLLEKLSALGQHQRIVQKKTEAGSDAAIYCRQVQQWMNMNQPIALPQNALKKLASPALAHTAKIAATPQVRLFEQLAKAAQQAHRALRHEFLPSITGGYFNKQIEGIPGFNGVELSLAMPLFFWGQAGKVQAAGREADMAQAESESRRIAIEALYQNRLQEFSKARQQLQWYEEQGLKIADALLFHAEKSYRSGNLGYVEYIQGLDQALTVRTEYLESLNLYNQTVTDLQFLSGNFN